MKTLYATIEKTPDGFDVFTENDKFSGVGDTAELAKADMMQQIEIYKKACKENNLEYPAYLDGDFEIRYKFDVQSLLQYYNTVFTNAALERITGINQKQLWKYANGVSKPRITQIKKIEQSLHRLGEELTSIAL